MIVFTSWNKKGLNSFIKHKEIKRFLVNNKIDFMVILETRLRNNNSDNNIEYVSNGKIWIRWNNNVIKVIVNEKNTQWHCEVLLNKESIQVYLTIIYGLDQPMERKD